MQVVYFLAAFEVDQRCRVMKELERKGKSSLTLSSRYTAHRLMREKMREKSQEWKLFLSEDRKLRRRGKEEKESAL